LVAARRETVMRLRLVVGGALAFGVTVEIAAGLMPSYLTFALLAAGDSDSPRADDDHQSANAFVQVHTEAGDAGAGDGALS
jgi:hypothetical protein